MTKHILQFTDAAAEHIQAILARNPEKKALRFVVKRTGCSGLMYVPELIDAPAETDVPITNEARITVYLKANAVPAVQGTVVDYVDHSLGQKQLHFDNPNADSLCGCGESFNLKPGVEFDG